MLHRCVPVALVIGLLAAAAFAGATQGGPIPVPLPLFPPNNWWNTDITAAPVDPNSTSYIAVILNRHLVNGVTNGAPLHPDFGGDAGGGDVYGFPFIVVDGTQPKLPVTFVYWDESDGTGPTGAGLPFYPIPNEAINLNGWVEGGQPGSVDQRSDADRHILIVDKTNNTLYELYNMWFDGASWVGGSGAFYDMNTNNRRPEGWTSADAAGLAILPGLVRYDELAAPGEIGHAFRVTVQSSNGHVYPASHTAGSTVGALPMGARLRLKASKDISSFSADIQKIFRAFKKYGLIVADNGSDMYISGTYDVRWNNGVLNPAFGSLKASDFEVVQLGWKAPVNFVISVPSPFAAGDPSTVTVTAYDGNYNVATGYTGTVHFSTSDIAATLPVTYTFTGGDNGTHTFTNEFVMRTAGAQTITATDVSDATITATRNVVVALPRPTGLTATAITTTRVDLSWTPVPGAVSYEVARAAAGVPYGTITTTGFNTYSDTSALASATYAYKVRAIDASSAASTYSDPDAATTLFFADDPLVAGSTVIQALHLTQARTAVNLMRAVNGLGNAPFNDPLPSGVAIQAIHLQQLRTALSQARSSLGLPAITFTDPGLTTGNTVRAVHVQEIRDGVK